VWWDHPGKVIRMRGGLLGIRQHPTEGATTEQVQVDVIDFLAGVGSAVQNEPIPRLVDPLFLGKPGGHPDHAAERRLVRIGHVGKGRNRFVGDDENVGGRLGLYIPKRCHQLILIHEISGDFASNDLREHRVRHSEHRPAVGQRGVAMKWLPANPPR